MRYRLDLLLKPAEGALVRVIGMVERRGFAPRAVQAVPASDGRWQLVMEVEGSRPPQTLHHQLCKVYDCESVSVSEVAAGQAVAA
ncbi:MAG: ACT domain-containing protein [Pseudoxanthomonas sp.]